VLKPGGLLVSADTVSPEDPATAEWMHNIEVRRDPSHVRNLPPSEWRTAIERSGMQITDSALSKVHLECEDWATRAGMSQDAAAAIRQDFLGAPVSAKEAFGIRTDDNDVVHFHWDMLAVRAIKVG
ncbi:MAG: hypothetical protein WD533_06850, partial [Dehalococcoidia bacterium]